MMISLQDAMLIDDFTLKAAPFDRHWAERSKPGVTVFVDV
jgi:hypothetical protein